MTACFAVRPRWSTRRAKGAIGDTLFVGARACQIGGACRGAMAGFPLLGGGLEGDVDETSRESGRATGSHSSVGRLLGLVARHPGGVVQLVLLLLVAIVVLQNVESTSINVLFWSVPDFPKLVLILVSMLIGAAAWEVARRWIRR